MASIEFVYDDTRHEIALREDLAPVTIGRLRESLPARIDIHCAKIAGQHIFWHAPFLTEIEAGADVMTLPPGSFLYWPERQFLELIYGELQAETASVTVLGRLTGDIAWLRALGEEVLARQGHEIVRAELVAGPDASAPTPAAVVSPELLRLASARERAWDAMPEEIGQVLGRRGVMLPYGPLAMAEGEFRKLHELLWRLRPASNLPGRERARIAAFLIEAFVARIDGFCHLTQSGEILRHARDLLVSRPGLVDPVIEETILYTGRLAAWLDLCIPWNDLNEATKRASASSLKAERVAAAHR